MKKINFGLGVKIVAAVALFVVGFCSCENSEDAYSRISYVDPTDPDDPTVVEMWDTSKDALEASKKINDATEEFKPVWVTYTNGKETSRTTFTASTPRVLRPLTSWKVEAKSYSQSTLRVELLSQQESDTVFYAKENPQVRFEGKRVVSLWQSTVTVDGSITEFNQWETIEVNDVVVTYKGKELALGHDDTAASNKSAVNESTGAYGDVLSYTFGDNTKYSTAPGLIVLTTDPDPDPDTFFPKEWGKLLAVKQANTKGSSSKTSINSWSLHFAKGTLPVMVEGDSPVWDFSNFEAGQTDERLNSGFYRNGVVINTIAEDKATQMSWRKSSEVVQGNVAYGGLDNWNNGKGWDDGHKVDGHYSVFNNHHSFTLDNSGKVGVLKVVDVRHNKTVGEFTYTLK